MYASIFVELPVERRAILKKTLIPVLASAAVAYVSGCSPYTQEKPVPPESSLAPSRLVEITATDDRLNPGRVFARPGESLTISFRNQATGARRIEFQFPGRLQKLTEDVPAGTSARLTFRVPDAPGDYVYFCPAAQLDDGAPGRDERALRPKPQLDDGAPGRDERALRPKPQPGQQAVKGILTVRQPPAVALAVLASGLTAPVMLATPADNSGRLFIVEQTGVVWVMTPGYELLAKPFIDIRSKLVELNPDYDERGLLGMAFHPDYKKNGRFYLYYTAPPPAGSAAGLDHTNRLSEWKVASGDRNVADAASERILLAIDQPQANHNGGMLAFGPGDKYLYVSLGDGGGTGDIDEGHTPGIGNAQDRTNLFGSILRIDVNHGSPYGIPADNPFVRRPGERGLGAPEVYAYGLRNPYRFSFDMQTHALYAGDAGQELWEEVSIIERAGNYGWNMREGTHCFNREDFSKPLVSCAETGPYGEPLQEPIIEFPNARQPGGVGKVVIGGYVYRGSTLGSLGGFYVFGTFGATAEGPGGTLLAASDPGPEGGLWPFQTIRIAGAPGGQLAHYVRGFGQDTEGEMYVLTSDSMGPAGRTGKVFRLVAP